MLGVRRHTLTTQLDLSSVPAFVIDLDRENDIVVERPEQIIALVADSCRSVTHLIADRDIF